MLVTPARPPLREKLSPAQHAVITARLLSESAAERAELVLANVAPATIEALYPSDFTIFVRAVSRELAEYGARHLRADVFTQLDWHTAMDAVSHLQRALDKAALVKYLKELDSEKKNPALQALGDQLRAGLKGWHPEDIARQSAANWAPNMLFAIWWFARQPESDRWSPVDQQVLRRVLVEKLLPKEVERHLA